jgi:hypothetical protein
MMIINQSFSGNATQDTATIRALSSIRSHQADAITRAVRSAGRAWDVQTFEDYDGYLSLLIHPIVQGDEQKSFSIAGTAQRLELSATCGDDLTTLACFSNVDDLVAGLIDLISH